MPGLQLLFVIILESWESPAEEREGVGSAGSVDGLVDCAQGVNPHPAQHGPSNGRGWIHLRLRGGARVIGGTSECQPSLLSFVEAIDRAVAEDGTGPGRRLEQLRGQDGLEHARFHIASLCCRTTTARHTHPLDVCRSGRL